MTRCWNRGDTRRLYATRPRREPPARVNAPTAQSTARISSVGSARRIRRPSVSCELAINPEADTTTATLSEDDFPYKIGRAEDVVSVRHLPAVRDTLHRVTIPMLGPQRLTGYVINMPAGGGVPTGIAMRYLDQAWVGSPAENVAAAHTAVIIGVNTFERLDFRVLLGDGPGEDGRGGVRHPR